MNSRPQLFLPILIFFLTSAARPQSDPSALPDQPQAFYFEISPFTGFMGTGGLFGIRGAMDYRSFNLELSTEQVIGKTANLYPVFLGFTLDLVQKAKAVPYGAVGGGLLFSVPGNAVGASTSTSPGLNFSLGLRYYLSKKFGFRFETKQLMTQVHHQIEDRDEILIFQETTAGLVFALR